MFSLSDLTGAEMEGADLSKGVFAATTLKKVMARGAIFNHAVMPFARLSGDFAGSEMTATNLNFADVSGANVKAGNFTFAYLLGTDRLDRVGYDISTNWSGAAALLPTKRPDLQSALKSLTSTNQVGVPDDVARQLTLPNILVGNRFAHGTILEKPHAIEMGSFVLGVSMPEARLESANLEATVFADVMAKRVRMANGAGLVAIGGTDLSEMTARGNFPGLVVWGSAWGGDMPKVLAGAVLDGSSIGRRGADFSRVTPGGATIIGDPERIHIESNHEAGAVKIVPLAKVPKATQKAVERMTRVSDAARRLSSRVVQSIGATPEFVAESDL